MGNGYAIACVVGPRKLMKHAHDVSSTYGGECVGLAAAKATIEVYRREPVIERLWGLGRRLQSECPILKGYPVHPWLDLGEDQRIKVVQYAAKEGVLIHPAGMNPMYAHTYDDVYKTAEIINEAVACPQSGRPA
jgi:acetylornithine/succinyldiaminopimelate/putrescine aminotransferase